MSGEASTCDRPPGGWACTLPVNHDGPCPTVPDAGAVRSAADEWLASVEIGFPMTSPVELQIVIRELLRQPAAVQDAIRDLLAGDR